MGEIVEFPHRRANPREGCARWNRGQGEITRAARPACAALAMALATSSPAIAVGKEGSEHREAPASPAILPVGAARASR